MIGASHCDESLHSNCELSWGLLRGKCGKPACLVACRRMLKNLLPMDSNVLLAHQSINNFMIGTMSEWLLSPDSFVLEQCAPAMVDIMMAGLQACPPRLSNLPVH